MLERRHTLNFNLPPLQKKLNRPELSLRRLSHRWEGYASHPLLLIEQSIAYLNMLNRYRVATGRRLALLEFVLTQCAHLISEAFQTFRDEGGFPETSKRRESLTSLLELNQQLLHGYLQVFLQDYTLRDYRYARVRARMPLVGLRILELARCRQMLLALRYQKMPAEVWHAVNQVFFVLYHYETVDRTEWLSGCYRPQLHSNEVREGARQKSTVRQLYISLQLLGMMDLMAWPIHEMAVVDAYLSALADTIAIKEEGDTPRPPAHLVTWFSNEGPPVFQRHHDRQGLLIDVSVLRKRINDDHLYIFTHEGNHDLTALSAPLALLTPYVRGLFVERMRNRLSPRQRREGRTAVHESRVMHIYTGFMEVHRQLMHRNSPEKGAGLTLSEMLAGRSALLADDARQCKEDWSWTVIDESNGGVQIWADERNYFNPLALERLVLYHDTSMAYEHQQVGYIGRLMRPAHARVGIAIIKLGTHAEGVIVQDESLKLAGKALPAILLRSADGRWQLALHARQLLQPGERIFLHWSDKEYRVRLGNYDLMQSEFILHNLAESGDLPTAT